MKRIEVVNMAISIKSHNDVVNYYNDIKPLPVGYKLRYIDDWCASFVSVVLYKCGYKKICECSVPRMIELAKKNGIYKDRTYKPKEGDVIVFDWDGVKDGDHVGIITSVNGGLIITREGNVSNDFCNRHIYMDDERITCYFAIPYDDFFNFSEAEKKSKQSYKSVNDIVKGVINGDFGNGEERKDNIYNYIQGLVNQTLKG